MSRSPIRTLLALRERETSMRATALSGAQAKAHEAADAKLAAERAREDHRTEVRGEVTTESTRLASGGCTAAELERLAMYTLGATLRDQAHGEVVFERGARHDAALAHTEKTRGQLAEAKVASRVIEKRAVAIDAADAKRLEARREEDR